MSRSQKTYKKGEILFKEGDKIQSLIFIQSGGVNQCLQRGKKNIDLFQLGSNHVLGETVLYGQANHATTAIATTETKVFEIPPEELKSHEDAANPSLKMLLKSLSDRLKLAMNDVKSARMHGDASPCPPEFVPQIFAAIYYTALHKGKKDEKGPALTVEWQMLRSYSQRVFGQSPKRVEQALNILVKLKAAEYVKGKNPDDPKGPDVVTEVKFLDVASVEAFFEFFQYYHYKPGRGELIAYDDFCAQLLEVFVVEGSKLTPDRHGVVSLPFKVVAEQVKEKMGINFSNDHFSRLENKGVLCKRRNSDDKGALLEFELKEYQYIFKSWKIIREIDRWNEKGFVDPDEKEEPKAKKSGPCCPQCSASVAAAAKFCQDCGAKLVSQAA